MGDNGEQIREKIDLKHFRDGNMDIDIYLDANEGTMRMKRVGFSDDEKHEVEINNINNCPQNVNGGWIPHFVFSPDSLNAQKLKICVMNPSFYGKP